MILNYWNHLELSYNLQNGSPTTSTFLRKWDLIMNFVFETIALDVCLVTKVLTWWIFSLLKMSVICNQYSKECDGSHSSDQTKFSDIDRLALSTSKRLHFPTVRTRNKFLVSIFFQMLSHSCLLPFFCLVAAIPA